MTIPLGRLTAEDAAAIARMSPAATPASEGASPEQQAQQARCSVAVGSAARDKWVADCIAYMVGIGIDADMARAEAEAWIEDNPEDVSECPKAIADDIMSYWVE
jgi:hypothetical protein